jgi:DNA polymerase V
MTIPLPTPTDDTRQLVKMALWGLKRIYKPHYSYAKAGVSLGDLISKASMPLDFFTSPDSSDRSTALMRTVDRINAKMGRESIKLASEGFDRSWQMKQGNKSPNYTTSWEQILCVKDKAFSF